MVNKKKVLIAGIGQSNFLKQLYSSIKRVAPENYKFDIYGLNELSGKDEYGISIFENIINIRKELLFNDLINLFDLKLIKLSCYFIRYGISYKDLKSFVRRFIITKSIFIDLDFQNYDIIHFHFPSFYKLDLFWHVKPSQKVIMSFWGSDLMRSKGIFNYYIQQEATNRADVVTTHGNEMKQQILTKFGRELENKVLLTRFPPYEKLYKLIEDSVVMPKTHFNQFYKKYQIPQNLKIVVIGHNGNPANNHLKIINALGRLPIEIKVNTFFVLPFAYLGSSDGSYENKCERCLRKVELNGIVLKDFMPWEDLAIFKCLTDIMIHMPISDALSGAMTEALFAGSKVIAGDWLPYSPFIREGLVFDTSNFESLSQNITDIYNSLPANEGEVLRNREIIKRQFFSDYCARTWINALDFENATS